MIHPLRLHRLQKGLSQYHLAWTLGISQVRISYAERGYPALNDEQKARVAAYFETSVAELFPECTVSKSTDEGEQ